MTVKDFTVTCYEHDVPPEIGPEMEKLYANVYSSLTQFVVSGGIASETYTYIAKEEGRVVAVFLFRIDKAKVRVLNEGMRLNDQHITAFARYVFAKYKAVNVISFNAIRADIQRLSYPAQRFNCGEDIVIDLPDSAEKYLASLGKTTRKNIRRYLGRIQQDFPSFRFDIIEKEAVTEQQIRDIIALKRVRTNGQNKAFTINEDEIRRTIKLVQMCGLLAVITIDNRICAGLICSRVGENYSSHIRAHDFRFDDYRLGTLCCYLAICESIARGGKEFHLLWGRYDYKYLLLGVQRDLDYLALYRSPVQFVLNGSTAIRVALKGYRRQLLLWFRYKAKSDNKLFAKALGLAKSIRNLKQARLSSRPRPQEFVVGGAKER